jgi:glycine hydroxymethyltransferase
MHGHLFLVDLTKQDITGKDAEAALGLANITANKNTVPNETRSPFITSGLRLGTPAVTTRGFKEPEVTELSHWICDILEDIKNADLIAERKKQAEALCHRFPVYRHSES